VAEPGAGNGVSRRGWGAEHGAQQLDQGLHDRLRLCDARRSTRPPRMDTAARPWPFPRRRTRPAVAGLT